MNFLNFRSIWRLSFRSINWDVISFFSLSWKEFSWISEFLAFNIVLIGFEWLYEIRYPGFLFICHFKLGYLGILNHVVVLHDKFGLFSMMLCFLNSSLESFFIFLQKYEIESGYFLNSFIGSPFNLIQFLLFQISKYFTFSHFWFSVCEKPFRFC